MSPLISPILASVIALVLVVLVFLIIYREGMKSKGYNRFYRSPEAGFFSMKIVMELSAAELACIVNTLFDLRKELRKPFFLRFWGYTSPETREAHVFIFDKYTRKLLTMEELYRANKGFDHDD